MKKNRIKKNLLIDHTSNQILMCRDFARKSANTESPEFQKLQEVRRDFPLYAIRVRSIKKSKKESYKGLTYSYMEDYINFYGTDADMAEYRYKRFVAECHTVRYPAIKQWFIKRFPEIKDYGDLPMPAPEQRCAV